jgi:tRNA(Ile)-lysidine synthase
MCLMDVLHQAGYNLIVGCFNHRLRPEANTEAQGVERACAILGIPFVFGTGDAGEYARQDGLTIEEAARALRYRFLFSQAGKIEAQAVAVAHTADDQVETLLMHLLRGSGLNGLVGMTFRTLPNAWSTDIPLIRPLLSLWRSEVETYIQERSLVTFGDQSNQDTRYTRNRVRRELIPYLETYNPQIKKKLWQTAELISADFRQLYDQSEIEWEKCLAEVGDGFIGLDIARLRALSPALQRLVLRRGINVLHPGLTDVDYVAIRRAQDCLSGSHGSQCDLVAGFRLVVADNCAWIKAPGADVQRDAWPQVIEEPVTLSIPGVTNISNGWQVSVEIVENSAEIMERVKSNQDTFQAWVSLEKNESLLTIRPRREGDRFYPLGMGGKSMKISDIMINQKIPGVARDRWPLVCRGKDILWVPGFQISEHYRAKPENQKLVWIQLFQAEGKHGN